MTATESGAAGPERVPRFVGALVNNIRLSLLYLPQHVSRVALVLHLHPKHFGLRVNKGYQGLNTSGIAGVFVLKHL